MKLAAITFRVGWALRIAPRVLLLASSRTPETTTPSRWLAMMMFCAATVLPPTMFPDDERKTPSVFGVGLQSSGEIEADPVALHAVGRGAHRGHANRVTGIRECLADLRRDGGQGVPLIVLDHHAVAAVRGDDVEVVGSGPAHDVARSVLDEDSITAVGPGAGAVGPRADQVIGDDVPLRRGAQDEDAIGMVPRDHVAGAGGPRRSVPPISLLDDRTRTPSPPLSRMKFPSTRLPVARSHKG